MQAREIQQADEDFADLRRLRLAFQPDEPLGLAALGTVATEIYGATDPAALGARPPSMQLHYDLFRADRPLRVCWIAVSPEYLWVSRSPEDAMPTPVEFGVFWARHAEIVDAVRTATGAEPEDGELLVALRPGADPNVVKTAMIAALGPDHVGSMTRALDLVGVRLLQYDVDGIRQMAEFFPVFFLGVGAFILLALMTRLVEAQRPLIGTMLALGMPRRRVLGHYASFAALIGAVGSAVGAGIGLMLGRALTTEYAGELKIPSVTVTGHPGLLCAGFAMGVGVAVLSGLAPAWRAARVAPADAMRAPPPTTGRLAEGLRRLPGLPIPLRMALRSLLRHPGRALATAVGVAAALVLVVTTSGVDESMRRAIHVQFEEAQTYDLRADLANPSPDADLKRAVSEIAGVRKVELALTAPVMLRANGKQASSLLESLAPDATLLRSLDFDGKVQLPRAGGVVLGRPIAKKLAVAVGDLIEVTAPGATPLKLRVDGLSDTMLGSGVAMGLADAQTRLGVGQTANTALVAVDPARATEAREKLAALPGVVGVRDAMAFRSEIDQVMGLSLVMIGTMLAFSVVLAAAILFNLATLSILERQRELATLRALGTSTRSIAAMVTFENGIVAGLGLLLGYPLSARTLEYTLNLYNSELFSLPFVLSARTFGVAALGVAGVLLAARAPALRHVSRLNLADAVRAREG